MIIQEDIEVRWDEGWLYQTDTEWDAIHRCLTDGRLTAGNGNYPLNFCILGGRALYSGNDFIIRIVTPDQAIEVGHALAGVREQDFRQKYRKIDPRDYGMALSEDEFAYTWEYFSGLPGFFSRSAAAGRFVIFTADQ
jgi:hypothetical protein